MKKYNLEETEATTDWIDHVFIPESFSEWLGDNDAVTIRVNAGEVQDAREAGFRE